MEEGSIFPAVCRQVTSLREQCVRGFSAGFRVGEGEGGRGEKVKEDGLACLPAGDAVEVAG